MSSDFSAYFQARDTQYNANGALESYAKHSKDSGFTWLFHQIGQFFKSIVGLSDYQKAYRALYGSLKSGGVVDPNARQVAVRILDLAAKGNCPTDDDAHSMNRQMQSAKLASGVVATVFLPLLNAERAGSPASIPVPPVPTSASAERAIASITTRQKEQVRALMSALPDEAFIGGLSGDESQKNPLNLAITEFADTTDNTQFYQKAKLLLDHMNEFPDERAKAAIRSAAEILGIPVSPPVAAAVPAAAPVPVAAAKRVDFRISEKGCEKARSLIADINLEAERTGAGVIRGWKDQVAAAEDNTDLIRILEEIERDLPTQPLVADNIKALVISAVALATAGKKLDNILAAAAPAALSYANYDGVRAVFKMAGVARPADNNSVYLNDLRYWQKLIDFLPDNCLTAVLKSLPITPFIASADLEPVNRAYEMLTGVRLTR